jgi:hypothetical protein
MSPGKLIGTYVVLALAPLALAFAFSDALPSIMASAPLAIPKDSKVTGWKCSFDDPGEGKMMKTK